jgi:enoyl-[acyl-carrier-protein] reductase (NADH)
VWRVRSGAKARRSRSPRSIPRPVARCDPELDIGGVAVFLASDDSRYVTGNTLFADGGSHINGGAMVNTPPLGR